MRTFLRSSKSCSPVWLMALLLSGCADWQSLTKTDPANPPKPKPPVRKEEAVHQFEAQRDDAQYQAAVANWRQGDFDACRDQLHKLLARSPDHLQGNLLMAEVQLMNSKPQEAYQHALRAVTKHPDDAAANHELATVLDAQGQTDKALEYYHRAAEAAPDNPLYQLSLQSAQGNESFAATDAAAPAAPARDDATVNKMSLPRRSNRPTPGGGVGTAITNQNRAALPGDLAAHAADIREARVLGAREVADEQAGERARRTVQPASYLANDEPARQPPKRSQSKDAEELRTMMADAPGNTLIPVRAALGALQHEQAAVAIDLAQTGLEVYPDCASLQRVLGTAYYRTGDYPAAELVLRQSLSLDKSNPATYFLLGSVLSKLGDQAGAEQCLRHAQALDPKYGAQAPLP
ncbi:MAG TPA: tetratricopeptide repeat protein [Pirellulales bacterium]|nr:tetratricopeptide repeat protein [Pirellulales bacterium]